jgi:hypothetical protein
LTGKGNHPAGILAARGDPAVCTGGRAVRRRGRRVTGRHCPG